MVSYPRQAATPSVDDRVANQFSTLLYLLHKMMMIIRRWWMIMIMMKIMALQLMIMIELPSYSQPHCTSFIRRRRKNGDDSDDDSNYDDDDIASANIDDDGPWGSHCTSFWRCATNLLFIGRSWPKNCFEMAALRLDNLFLVPLHSCPTYGPFLIPQHISGEV